MDFELFRSFTICTPLLSSKQEVIFID